MVYLLLAIAVLALIGPRINEIFLVSIRDGRVLAVRGRIPPSLLSDFSDIAREADIRRAAIRAVRDVDHARLLIRGVDSNVAQRFRNVFGVHPIHMLRTAPVPEERNFETSDSSWGGRGLPGFSSCADDDRSSARHLDH